MLVLILPVLIFANFVAPLGFVLSGFDPLRYFMDYFLPAPLYRSTLVLSCSFILRYVTVQLVFLELFRTILFLVFLLLVILSRITSILQTLSNWKYNPAVCCRLYKLLFIVAQEFLQILKFPGGITLSTYFLGVLCLSWFCVKMNSAKTGLIIYYWCVILLILAIIVGISALVTVSRSFDYAKKIVENVRYEAKLAYRNHPCKKTRVDMLNARGMLRIHLNYALIGDVGIDFLKSFLHMLVLRSFDAILIVSC